MSEKPRSQGLQGWLGPVIAALLAAQLGLTWIHGSLLHRQHEDIQGLREDLQDLSDSLDQEEASGSAEAEGVVPAQVPFQGHFHRRRMLRAARLVRQQEEPDQAAKDLEAARQSAQKAVKEARETQQKLSIEENARKAEEKAKLQGASNAWQKWLWIGLGAGLAALVARSWLRRRG